MTSKKQKQQKTENITKNNIKAKQEKQQQNHNPPKKR